MGKGGGEGEDKGSVWGDIASLAGNVIGGVIGAYAGGNVSTGANLGGDLGAKIGGGRSNSWLGKTSQGIDSVAEGTDRFKFVSNSFDENKSDRGVVSMFNGSDGGVQNGIGSIGQFAGSYMGGSGGSGSNISSILGKAGQSGGPSLDMGTVGADGMRTFSEDGASFNGSGSGMLGSLFNSFTAQGSGRGLESSSTKESGSFDASGMLQRLLKFQSDHGATKTEGDGAQAAKLMEIAPRYANYQNYNYSVPAPQMIQNRPIADNRRY